MTSSLGRNLICKALVSTKPIHVHKSVENDDFWHSGTLGTCMDDQCQRNKAKQ